MAIHKPMTPIVRKGISGEVGWSISRLDSPKPSESDYAGEIYLAEGEIQVWIDSKWKNLGVTISDIHHKAKMIGVNR